MPSLFAITTGTNRVTLDAARRAEIAFTVSNTSGRAARGRGLVAPETPAAAAWFTLLGEAERELPVAGTQQYAVQIALQPDAPAGSYRFRLDMVGVENPDEQYTQGPAVTFEVSAPAPKKPFPWWIVALAVGLLVVAGIVVAVILLSPRSVTIPNLRGETFADAAATLSALELEPGDPLEAPGGGLLAGQVIGSTPAPGTEAERGSGVTLVVAAAETATPTPTPTPPPTATPPPAPTPFGGACIAFLSDRDGQFGMWVMAEDETRAARVTGFGPTDQWLDWSPDGTRVVFERRLEGDPNPEIFVMGADGSNPINLTRDPSYDTSPVWSPDGARIAFGSSRTGDMQVYVMNADGSALTQLTATTARNYQPAWSPDGTRIAFESERDGQREIYVMNADGTDQTRLTFRETAEYGPAWSPDSTRLVFSSLDGLWVVKVADRLLSQLTVTEDGRFNDMHPSWSPDGTQIVFASNGTPDFSFDIFVIGADGSGRRQLTQNPATDIQPKWARCPAP